MHQPLPASTDEMVRVLQEIDPNAHSDDERRVLLAAAKALVGRLSSAWEQTWQATVTDPVKLAALRTLILLDPFETWSKNQWKPSTSDQLVKQCRGAANPDSRLLTRLLDVACACHCLLREGDLYSPGPFDWAPALVRDPTLKGAYMGFVDWTAPLFQHLPHFLQYSEFQNPEDGSAANYQHLYQRDGAGIYLDLASNPILGQGVQDFMQANTRYTLAPWTSICPISSMINAYQSGQVFLVDVGGGNGQDLRQVVQQFPNLPQQSLILQDLPAVVDHVDLSGTNGVIAKQTYNYMEPQSVKGARYYYFKNIIHNLPDELAIKVLRNQASAMSDDSRILIYERFKHPPGIPESPEFVAYSSLAAQDVFMMGMFSSQERSQEQYEVILQSAELEMCKLHEPRIDGSTKRARLSCDRIIEARLTRRDRNW